MLESLLIVLVILWVLGFFALNLGGLVHILLIVAVVVLFLRLLRGRKLF